MASLKAACSTKAAAARASCAFSRAAVPSRRVAVQARAQVNQTNVTSEVSKFVAVSSAAASLLYSGNAMAASELASLAAGDNRTGIIFTLFVPALGWVGFNMLTPIGNQLAKMAEDRDSARRGVAVGLGLAASMLFAQNAEAATQVAQLAEGDNRTGIILSLFIPILGWVGFNMLQPLLNQLDKMADERDSAKRGIAIGLGAAASMLLAQSAEAATQVAELAESDNRLGIIFTLFVPALGWVGFNMLTPIGNQLAKMAEERENAKRGIAIGLGAAASMLLAQSAEAATQVAELAAGDNRTGIIFTLFVPALGWVGFNMLNPISNQLAKMAEEREAARR